MRPHSQIMTKRVTHTWLVLAALIALAPAGCIVERSKSVDGDAAGSAQTADRKFSVRGPVRIELTNGSGNARVTTGAPGEVQVHAELRAKNHMFHDGQKRLDEMIANPPISQDGDLIRIGGLGEHGSGVIINYTITVPPETQVHAMTSSGKIEVTGTKDPASFIAGSGTIIASNIDGDVQVTVGSGDAKLSKIRGQVQAMSGSGNIELAEIQGDIRVQTGSGTIKITNSIGAVEANSGSGNITLGHVTTDVRLHTSSGDVTIDGNPLSNTYWDMRTSSGSVTLHVPADANFRLYARTSSGDIDTQIPITMEGTAAKHELRARIGEGKARVEIETGSGKIQLR
jgi:hypothetical protein